MLFLWMLFPCRFKSSFERLLVRNARFSSSSATYPHNSSTFLNSCFSLYSWISVRQHTVPRPSNQSKYSCCLSFQKPLSIYFQCLSISKNSWLFLLMVYLWATDSFATCLAWIISFFPCRFEYPSTIVIVA